MALLYLLISFGASVIGGICGIGGGIIIKPLLEMFNMASVSTISFLSGCTVLSLTLYSVSKNLSDRSGTIRLATGTPLAIGAAVGGVAGKYIFDTISTLAGNDSVTGASQALVLLLLTFCTMLYSVKKASIRPMNINCPSVCLVIGLILGTVSSFLGIGGGPFNLVVLHYFFSMETKPAAANSLYIILFSQATNLLITICSGKIPAFDLPVLILMVLGGIFGGMAGRACNKRLSNNSAGRLFVIILFVIMGICIYNAIRYLYLT
jgi:uncharacterized membrane protein YfcA